jgi:hypothetical protein
VHPDASKPERVTPVQAWTGCRSLRFLGGGARIGGREAERRMAAVEGGGGGANGCAGSVRPRHHRRARRWISTGDTEVRVGGMVGAVDRRWVGSEARRRWCRLACGRCRRGRS